MCFRPPSVARITEPCSECGTPKDSMVVCPNCGFVPEIDCPKCGTKNPLTEPQCTKCGYKAPVAPAPPGMASAPKMPPPPGQSGGRVPPKAPPAPPKAPPTPPKKPGA
ncbi:MAG: hypothetical protein JEZ06_20420 [Anaerolineaceae bacterium]|nr:hypothetical protein [Anaerolineaceae bacterium]